MCRSTACRNSRCIKVASRIAALEDSTVNVKSLRLSSMTSKGIRLVWEGTKLRNGIRIITKCALPWLSKDQ